MRVLSAPVSVFLAVTNRCNIVCKHCNVFPTRNSDEDLSTEEMLSLIRELAEIKVFSLRISGGEPLVREDIFRLMDEIARHPMRMSLNTNAMLVDDGVSRRLAEYRRVDEVMVSLDGSCAEVHDALRGSRSFARTVRGIENLLLRGHQVTIYTTVTRLNRLDLEGTARLAKGLGIGTVKFNELLPQGNAMNHLSDLMLSPSERRSVIERVMEMREELGDLVCGTCLDAGVMFDGMERARERIAAQDFHHCLVGCRAGIMDCTIRPDGWVVPCDRLWGMRAGNVREERLADIWRNSPAMAEFRRRFSYSMENIPACASCSFKAACTGGCPAIPYQLSGTIFDRDLHSCFLHYSGEESADVLRR